MTNGDDDNSNNELINSHDVHVEIPITAEHSSKHQLANRTHSNHLNHSLNEYDLSSRKQMTENFNENDEQLAHIAENELSNSDFNLAKLNKSKRNIKSIEQTIKNSKSIEKWLDKV